MALCREAGFDEELRRTAYWVALLRYVGCTGHAHEVASVFGDDIAILAQTLVMDAADPADVGRTMVAAATAGHPPEEHAEIVRALQAGAHDWAVHNFATGCEVGDMLIQRLDLGPEVRTAFGFTYERWNGNGYPTHAKGEQIPLAMRIVHLTHDMEAIGRRSLTGRGDRRRPRPSRPDVRPGARGPVRRPRHAGGSSTSTRWTPGRPCWTSNPNPDGRWRVPRSTRPSRWRPTSST